MTLEKHNCIELWCEALMGFVMWIYSSNKSTRFLRSLKAGHAIKRRYRTDS